MDRDEALRLLGGGKEGVREWNRRRAAGEEVPDFVGADLRGVDLRKADLRGANLRGANLREANLREANLGGANLIRADLTAADLTAADLRKAELGGANLGGADLFGADLRAARLFGVDLDGADLRGADLRGANLPAAGLGGADLAGAILRGCAVPDALPSSTIGSCIISYSSADQPFAECLYADLQAKGIRCGLDHEHLKVSIRVHNRLLLVLSAQSVASEWVCHEIETALEKERRQGRLVLFPIRLDDAVMEAEAGWAELVRRRWRHLGDFRGWKDYIAYQEALARLLCDLAHQALPKLPPGLTCGLEEAEEPTLGATLEAFSPVVPPPQVEISQAVMTAYYPKEVEPRVWHPLHAYIFRESAASQVEADARERLGERINQYRRLSKTARRPIAKGSTITAIPRLEGFQFNPPSQTVELLEDWHRLDFRLRARPELVGTASNGLLTFTVEGVIVADIPISIYVGDRPMTAEMVHVPGRPYGAIFCSYSRRDTCVVKHVERACKTLGIDYLRDVVSLRSGEPWQPALLSMIERADIFQLFWSRNAVRSKYVEEEWRYALRLGREPSRFIRPVYWTEPMPSPPPELGHLTFAFVPELASRLWRFVSHTYRLVARLRPRPQPALRTGGRCGA